MVEAMQYSGGVSLAYKLIQPLFHLVKLIVYPRPRHKLAWAALDMGCNYIEYIEKGRQGV